MTNGSNSWGVAYSHIAWMKQALAAHANLIRVTRHHDLVFETQRRRQNDSLQILCVNEYTMGITLVQTALAEFGPLNAICVGGGWNGYTRQAKWFCVENRIGLFVTAELMGALWQDDYWTHHRRDKDGNPEYPFRAE